MGVILDNRIRSAPNLNARISTNGVITGNFSRQEVDELVHILDAGQLPFALKKQPSSVFQIGATLGLDTIRSGTISIVVALAAVVIFICCYYLFAGLVAVSALVLNLLFTVALMVMFKATWTLPGLAGLVLTVGMSVDANVLIFERIREELDHGSGLGLAIRNGYDKAFSTILDANVTTILTAIILFGIGTDQVKGFAVTLILGIATSMFCALYITRTVFNIAYNERWLKNLRMLRFFANPNFNFLAPRQTCYVISLIVVVVGVAALAARGSRNLDIDFTGGTMVGVHLNKPLDAAQVRQMASEVLQDVAVENVQFQGEEPNRRYVIRTTERDPEADAEGHIEGETVRHRIADVFRGYLDTPKMTFDPPKPIEKPAGDEAKDKKAQELAKALGRFPGGQQTTLHFDKEQSPRSVAYVRNHLADVILAQEPGAADIEDRYALVPLGDPIPAANAGDPPGYFDFLLAMAGNAGLEKTATALAADVAELPEFDQFNQFGPQVAGETRNIALVAIAASWICIIVYLWLRFGTWAFGLAAVIALIHDVVIGAGLLALTSLAASALGLESFGLSEMKFNLTTVAALLTLIGYSVNDTIIVFDRIREVRGKSPRVTEEMVNRSLNGTLSRTIITSLTTFAVVFILFVGGGSTLSGFSFVLMAGVVVGTYSSIYIASPALLSLLDFRERRRQARAAAMR